MGGRGNSSGMNTRPRGGHGRYLKTRDDKIGYIQDLTGYSAEESDKILTAIERYTGAESGDIRHGKDAESQRLIDKFLNNKDVPVYGGDTFRGLVIRPENGKSGEEILLDKLKSGRWDESGLTSSSSKRSVAKDLVRNNYDPNSVSVIIHNVGNKTGVSVSNLSSSPMWGENEVLYPSSIKNRGFDVLGYTKSNLRPRGGVQLYEVTVRER